MNAKFLDTFLPNILTGVISCNETSVHKPEQIIKLAMAIAETAFEAYSKATGKKEEKAAEKTPETK